MFRLDEHGVPFPGFYLAHPIKDRITQRLSGNRWINFVHDNHPDSIAFNKNPVAAKIRDSEVRNRSNVVLLIGSYCKIAQKKGATPSFLKRVSSLSTAFLEERSFLFKRSQCHPNRKAYSKHNHPFGIETDLSGDNNIPEGFEQEQAKNYGEKTVVFTPEHVFYREGKVGFAIVLEFWNKNRRYVCPVKIIFTEFLPEIGLFGKNDPLIIEPKQKNIDKRQPPQMDEQGNTEAHEDQSPQYENLYNHPPTFWSAQ
jgi:hypothetical protein